MIREEPAGASRLRRCGASPTHSVKQRLTRSNSMSSNDYQPTELERAFVAALKAQDMPPKKRTKRAVAVAVAEAAVDGGGGGGG